MATKRKRKKKPVTKPQPGRCNAKRKDGTYCARYPMKGRDRCQKHGGKSPRGEAHHNWKGGTSKSYLAKHLPHRLAEKFEAALADPELVSMRGNLALSATRLGELLEKLPTKESAQVWEDLRSLMVPLRTAVMGEETEEAVSMLDHMHKLMNKAIQERRLWEEILDVQEHHRRLADTERKREDHLQAHVTAHQFTLFLAFFYRKITEIVSDPQEVTRLGDAISHIMRLGPADPRAFLDPVVVDGDAEEVSE